jgi:hypothetical protein
MSLRLCLDGLSSPNNAGVHCTLLVTAVEGAGTHMYHLATDSVCANGAGVQGDWDLEMPSTIELEHD